MIWHAFEVWLIVLATFLIGCTMGALAYEVIARSHYADAQGALADSVGDVVDRIKDRFGLGPAWRPQHRRIVESAVPETVRMPPPAEAEGEVVVPEGTSDAVVDGDSSEGVTIGAESEEVLAEEAENDAVDDETAFAGDRVAVAADEIVPMRPASLAEPRNGVPDNLQRIRGIGERNEMRLNNLGIFHFGQIAAWTPAEMRWVAQQLAFPERIERDDWVGQAIILASGGDTGFTKSAERRRARRQQEQAGPKPADDELT
jgi:predicted flap endonuclease-1-like 5' DNA nuclease